MLFDYFLSLVVIGSPGASTFFWSCANLILGPRFTHGRAERREGEINKGKGKKKVEFLTSRKDIKRSSFLRLLMRRTFKDRGKLMTNESLIPRVSFIAHTVFT